jgi:hypothetical protein
MDQFAVVRDSYHAKEFSDWHRSRLELWKSFCRIYRVAEDSVPLFECDEDNFVQTKEVGNHGLGRRFAEVRPLVYCYWVYLKTLNRIRRGTTMTKSKTSSIQRALLGTLLAASAAMTTPLFLLVEMKSRDLFEMPLSVVRLYDSRPHTCASPIPLSKCCYHFLVW